MVSIIVGSLLISLLHGLIPSHWLPVIAIGRKENWGLVETEKITFIAALAHVLSTVIIGIFFGIIGLQLSDSIKSFTHIIAPSILILVGFYFIRQHYVHHHFHLQNQTTTAKPKKQIIGALVLAMFLSPCLEIEGYFLMAGSYGWWLVVAIALLYSIVSISGMMIWIQLAYKGLLRLNWHKWEHNAGLISGGVLIATGVLSFFIS
jgi:nickel/cobalt exporter